MLESMEIEGADGYEGTTEIFLTKGTTKEGDQRIYHCNTPTIIVKKSTNIGRTCKIMIIPVVTNKETFGMMMENFEWPKAIEDKKHGEKLIMITR